MMLWPLRSQSISCRLVWLSIIFCLMSACGDEKEKVPPSTGVEPGPIEMRDGNDLVWRKADLTHYTSYPEPGSEECQDFSGCEWAGMFAALDEKQSKEWVKNTNIVSVHQKDFNRYRLKTLLIRKGGKSIEAKVYDKCSNSDCNNCCSKNSEQTGFLIDLESFTAKRFGEESGVIEWTCLDCGT